MLKKEYFYVEERWSVCEGWWRIIQKWSGV